MLVPRNGLSEFVSPLGLKIIAAEAPIPGTLRDIPLHRPTLRLVLQLVVKRSAPRILNYTLNEI